MMSTAVYSVLWEWCLPVCTLYCEPMSLQVLMFVPLYVHLNVVYMLWMYHLNTTFCLIAKDYLSIKLPIFYVIIIDETICFSLLWIKHINLAISLWFRLIDLWVSLGCEVFAFLIETFPPSFQIEEQKKFYPLCGSIHTG